ncbi:MAG: hypothetical protein QOH57_1561, partial [Mycobacterium sp.]|nr:hypothetical protein [Mycobacterium sp.]
PYAHTGNLYDVTSGNNGTCSPTLLCTAAAGWDGPTGLGTPNGVAAFNGTSSSGTGATTKNTVTITKPGNRTGTVGIATSLQISAADSGGAALTYTATGLPTGLSINASGRISGKPTTPRTFTTTVTATDSTKSSAAATFTWTISSNCTGQKLVNPGFESGATGWSHTSGIIRTASTARTGKRLARLDGTATTRTDTLSQAVKIPTGCSATLTYYLQISSADHTTRVHDRLALTINGTKKTSLSNLNRGTRYIKHTLNLSSYAGKTVTIKWTGTENNSLQTSFRLDDTAVTLTKAT